jgi:cobalt/nickel transport system permease protein
VVYLIKANQSALNLAQSHSLAPETGSFSKWRGLCIGLAVLVIASPLGLLAPGTAWGEWGAAELIALGLPAIPTGLAKLSNLWSAPLPDYEVSALGNANLAYIFSAIVGIFITIVVVWLFTLLVTRAKPQKVTNK